MVDGGTVKVRMSTGRRVTVRLIGIDAPEIRSSPAPECGASQASAALKRLAFRRVHGRRVGRAVSLTTDRTQGRFDRYGRLLAYAKVDGGKVLQREQLRLGWASVYFSGDRFERAKDFAAVESSARDAGRGVWRRCGGNFHMPA